MCHSCDSLCIIISTVKSASDIALGGFKVSEPGEVPLFAASSAHGYFYGPEPTDSHGLCSDKKTCNEVQGNA